MFRILALVAAVCFSCATQESAESIPRELVGIWKLESTAFKGAVATRPEKPAWLIILGNGELVLKFDNEVQAGTVAVDASATPIALDLRITMKSGPSRKWTNLGVCEIKEDTLTIAKAADGEDRPNDFKPNARSVVQVYRRTAE